jgi:phosphoglucomutase
MLFAEMVCFYTASGVGIYQKLQELYSKYGFVYDTNVSTAYKGLNAMAEMNAVVDKIKTETFSDIGGEKVLATRDYSIAKKKFADGKVEDIDTPKTNAVYYELEGGSFVCVRPSGTEPKLKVYYSIRSVDEQSAMEKFAKMKEDFEQKLK